MVNALTVAEGEVQRHKVEDRIEVEMNCTMCKGEGNSVTIHALIQPSQFVPNHNTELLGKNPTIRTRVHVASPGLDHCCTRLAPIRRPWIVALSSLNSSATSS